MSLQESAIIASTLREGEQFVDAFFSIAEKIQIATLLDAFGVEYLEPTSPLASLQSPSDCETIAAREAGTSTNCPPACLRDGNHPDGRHCERRAAERPFPGRRIIIDY